ncbi:DUF6195 family protein [Streptomyces sp. NPDC050610]|uniref:DUF6195 family protein n=1 Tax=Streptomyces sp. NPDC050610 TaxID=3157097 RepID=UPI0034439625
MTHPLMFAAAKRLVTEEERRTAAREHAFRAWGPRAVAAASKYARRLLGDEAVTLDWQAPGVLHLEEQLQASASLDTVAGQRLELHYSWEGEGTERLVLRRSCTSCPSQQVDVVASLEHLGRLLAQTPAWRAINPRDGGVQA